MSNLRAYGLKNKVKIKIMRLNKFNWILRTMTNRIFYPTLRLQGLNCRNYGTPFPVRFPPLSSHMCNNAPLKPCL